MQTLCNIPLMSANFIIAFFFIIYYIITLNVYFCKCEICQKTATTSGGFCVN